MTSDPVAVALTEALQGGATLPERPGVTGNVDVSVGDTVVSLRFEDGHLAAAAPGAGEAADVTLTLPSDEAASVLAGVTAPSVAFMRGRLKTAGDNGLVLGVLAVSAGPEFETWRSRVAAALGR